jgi:glycosyltransferase involved in cell wall biosynthesis
LAATLAEVLADPAELRRLGECGRQAVAERFSDAAMAREVLTETQFLLAHSRSPASSTRL